MHHHEVGKTFRAIGQCRSSLNPCHTGGNFLLQLGRAEPPKETAVMNDQYDWLIARITWH